MSTGIVYSARAFSRARMDVFASRLALRASRLALRLCLLGRRDGRPPGALFRSDPLLPGRDS